MSGLMLNEDDSHFYFDRSPEKMTIEGLHELIDHYRCPQMKEIMLNVNGMRTSYRSNVWNARWDGYDPEGGDDQPFFNGLSGQELTSFRNGINNMRLLHMRGIDPYRVWIDRTRGYGISPWISMRMNDLHDVNRPEICCHSDFWRTRQDLWRRPYRFENWTDRALDYGQQEVRDYHMALIKELLERYDMDGLELDWMRFGFHFRVGFEEEGRRLLIDFHKQVRVLADQHARRLGHPIKIGVRVPSRPQTARGLGLDAIAWAKQGLIDMIVITPFWATVEFDMPVELWKELLGDSKVILAAGLEINLRPHIKVWPKYPENMSNSAETVFGAAASLLHRGADRIYLFNYMDSVTTVDNPADYPEILNKAGSLETIVGNSRRHVVTFMDTWAPGEPQAHLLPAQCGKNMTASFRIHIGPKPENGTAQVYVGMGENGSLDVSALEVRVNGKLCPSSCQSLPIPFHPVVQKVGGFEIPIGILHDGYNVVEVTGTLDQSHEINWIEIMIRPMTSI